MNEKSSKIDGQVAKEIKWTDNHKTGAISPLLLSQLLDSRFQTGAMETSPLSNINQMRESEAESVKKSAYITRGKLAALWPIHIFFFYISELAQCGAFSSSFISLLSLRHSNLLESLMGVEIEQWGNFFDSGADRMTVFF